MRTILMKGSVGLVLAAAMAVGCTSVDDSPAGAATGQGLSAEPNVTAPTAPAAASPPQPGGVVARTYTNAAGTRSYNLFVPSSGGAGKPLLVYLHGCAVPPQAEAGHALAKVAEEKGFSVVWPLQTITANIALCWNWFDPRQIKRDSGEASILAGITTSVRDELGADSQRVYVAGYSAGGAMTTVMGATYPDVYAAISPSAGAPYDIFDVSGKLAYEAMGPRARPVPAFILQGVLDEASLYVIGRGNITEWLGADDYADDGALNNSVSKMPAALTPRVMQTTPPLPVLIERYTSGNCELAEFWTTPYEHLLNGALFYYDVGLDLQRTMMDFLLAHKLGGPRQGCGG